MQQVIEGACEVWWARGGIRLDPQASIFTPPLPATGYNSTKPDGTDIFSVSLSKEADLPVDIPTSVDVDLIEVYLVDKLDDSRGGGVAQQCGSSSAYIVLEIDHLPYNRFLLAHELGHVLGLRHPDGTTGTGACNNADLPYGSTCAVMVPDRPNSPRVTSTDLSDIETYNPNLGNAYMVIGSGGRNASSAANYYQIVRDFAYDDGSDPSGPRPPATNWTSYSDIWNAPNRPYQLDRHKTYSQNNNTSQKGGAMFSASYHSNHTQPTNSGPNYMYVRVHTCQPLTTGNPGANLKAHLFLARPGVSNDSLIKLPTNNSSDNPLSFTGANQPAMGGPRVMHAQWEVPNTVPPHCCAFAVVTSVDEPAPNTPPSNDLQDVIDHPENHNYFALRDRLTTDNDVAQRNLYVGGVSPTMARRNLPPMPFANIFDEAVAASLEIDATDAELDAVVLLVNGQEVVQIKGGQRERVQLREQLPPGEEMTLVLQAAWPKERPLGTTFPVWLGFYLGEKLVNDYEYVIQVVEPREAAIQAMDALYGALQGVIAAWDVAEARGLATDMRQIVWWERGVIPSHEVSSLPESWDKEFRKLNGRFATLAQQIKYIRNDMPELKEVQRRLENLAEYFQLPDMENDQLMAQIQEQAYFIRAKTEQVARRGK